MTTQDTTDILTPAEAAAWLKLPEKTVLALCRQGRIRGAVKFGKRWRLSRTALEGTFQDASKDAPPVQCSAPPPRPPKPRRSREADNRAAILLQLRS